MSIKRENKENESDKFTLEFDNGDARAFDKIIKEWGFTDNAQAMLRFAMATMIATKNKTLFIVKEDGSAEKIVPGEGLVKKT